VRKFNRDQTEPTAAVTPAPSPGQGGASSPLGFLVGSIELSAERGAIPQHAPLSKIRIITSTPFPAAGSTSSGFKIAVWTLLGLTTLFVVITSEVFLAADYPMYHAYRLQVIADRHILIPHTLCGFVALLAGPLQFSSRLRRRHLKFHRLLGRIYVFAVFIGASTGIALAAGRPGLPGTSMQAAAWIVCTSAAFITARNRQIDRHRHWMARSYAVTFTFVSSRVLNLWPLYWSHLGDALAGLGVAAFTLVSLLIVDLGIDWGELTTRRS
jgi:uncharacterized membrane protein